MVYSQRREGRNEWAVVGKQKWIIGLFNFVSLYEKQSRLQLRLLSAL